MKELTIVLNTLKKDFNINMFYDIDLSSSLNTIIFQGFWSPKSQKGIEDAFGESMKEHDTNDWVILKTSIMEKEKRYSLEFSLVKADAVESIIIALDNKEKVSRMLVYRKYTELMDYINDNLQYKHLRHDIDLEFDMARESL